MLSNQIRPCFFLCLKYVSGYLCSSFLSIWIPLVLRPLHILLALSGTFLPIASAYSSSSCLIPMFFRPQLDCRTETNLQSKSIINSLISSQRPALFHYSLEPIRMSTWKERKRGKEKEREGGKERNEEWLQEERRKKMCLLPIAATNSRAKSTCEEKTLIVCSLLAVQNVSF